MPDAKPPKKVNSLSSDMAADAFSLMNDEAKSAHFAQFASTTADICMGIYTCLNIIEASQRAHPDNPAGAAAAAKSPQVTSAQALALQKFVRSSALLMHASAESHIHAIQAHTDAQKETLMAIKRALKRDAE
ncbi:hypothetical protein [Glaciimonas sp. PCH181]|uniref:hypothetical protein n=1 Tax=Glaciimonas sp. PCH181 TaxID=2133943 RepID=UPI000D3B1E5F|nr:hypothetical protein [Glaciimonas sp. PCH181]PUA17756.1 hypothetical protein C7W93_17995 [Glaciimonas sp. PCH181]